MGCQGKMAGRYMAFGSGCLFTLAWWVYGDQAAFQNEGPSFTEILVPLFATLGIILLCLIPWNRVSGSTLLYGEAVRNNTYCIIGCMVLWLLTTIVCSILVLVQDYTNVRKTKPDHPIAGGVV